MSDKKNKLIAYLGIPALIYVAMEVFYILSNVEYARIPWIPGFIFCLIILFAIFYLINGFIGNTYYTTVIVSIFIFILLVVDQMKIALSNDPVFLNDILFLNSTGTMMDILRVSIWGIIVRYALLVVLLIVAFVYITRLAKIFCVKRFSVKHRLLQVFLPLILFVTMFLPFKSVTDPFMIIFFNIEGRQDSYATTNMGYYFKFGFLSGIYGNYIENRLVVPDDYDNNELVDVLQDVDISNEDTGGFGQPNIMMIFSESFWDIDCISEQVKFNKEVAPNFKKLSRQGKLINMISPSYGGISANVEYEMLTSGSIKFFSRGYIPYMQLYRDEKYYNSPSVIKELRNNGYMTHLTSTWEPSLFNCQKVYEYMGVDKVEYDIDLEDSYKKGGRISDEYVAEHVKDVFDNKEKGEKLFYMVMTAQAHMPFPKDKYKKDEYDIEIEESNLSGEEEDTIRCYAQGVYDADKQLKMLYDYIQTLDEPTLLIFYGDHLPYLKTESSDDITKHLDYFNTEDDILNYYRRYNTQCLILSNYLEDSDYITKDTDYLGPDMIMPYVLNKMDIKVSNYYKWLYTMRHFLPSSNLSVSIDNDGKLYDTSLLEGKMKECFDLRNKMNWKQFIAVE